MIADASASSITSIKIAEKGNVTNSQLSDVHLHYDLDTTSPYDCVSESFSESDPTYGNSGTFDFSNKVTFTGSVEITPTKAACYYVVLDIGSNISNGDTLDIEISNPSSDIVASGGATISPSSIVMISGTTVLTKLADPSIVVSSVGSQVSNLVIPSTDQYVGGLFRIAPNTGSTSITEVTIRQRGSVADLSIQDVHLYYDLDTTFPYDCVSESFSESDQMFGGSSAFSGNLHRSTFSGNITVTPSQVFCFYVVLDIQSTSFNNTTLDIEISNPSSDVIVSGSEYLVTPSTSVSVSGTTSLGIPDSPVVTLSSIGTQAPLMTIPSVNQYVGGAFSMVPNFGSTFITKIVVTKKGTIFGDDLTNVHIYYDLDTTSPYDCSGEFFFGGDQSYDFPVPFIFNRATLTGLVEITPTKAACFYVVLDVGESSSNGDALEIEISRPSSDIVASGGSIVVPSFNSVGIVGTTILTSSSVLQDSSIADGDLIRQTGDIDIYIAKFVGPKKFKRLVLSPSVFDSYGHLKWNLVKEVSNVSQFTTSTLVRETNDQTVYQLEPSGDEGVKRHINMTPSQFTARGFDWDSLYIINTFERDLYQTGSPLLF